VRSEGVYDLDGEAGLAEVIERETHQSVFDAGVCAFVQRKGQWVCLGATVES